jgi:hypothetical protein
MTWEELSYALSHCDECDCEHAHPRPGCDCVCHPLDPKVVTIAVTLTAPEKRFLVHGIVDDDWNLIGVACDLPERHRPIIEEPDWVNDPEHWDHL